MEAPLIGEANVFDDDIDSFLAISKELKIKGLTRRSVNINMIINKGVGIYLKEK